MAEATPNLTAEWAIRSRRGGQIWSRTPSRDEAAAILAQLKRGGRRGLELIHRLELVGLRANGSAYTGGYGPVRHQPGPGLFAPCPWHAWNYPHRHSDGVRCRCGWRPQVSA
jgi:hypothetical protein